MKVVPQAFYQHPKIENILVDGLSCVLFKSVQYRDLQNQRYMAAHALSIILNGSLQVENSDGEVTMVKKNQMIFLPKEQYLISDIIPKNESFEAIVFFFDKEICDEFLTGFDFYDLEDIPKTLILEYNQDIRLFTDTLFTLYRGKSQHQFTKPKLLELLHLISLSDKGDQFITKLQSLKKLAKKNIKYFMKENFDKPLSIEDYAYLTGRSISTFRRDFKSRFGISPKKWLIEKRLEKASTLLKEKSDSVTNIALQVGYENPSHFIRAFHKQFGISPKQYQMDYRKNMLV